MDPHYVPDAELSASMAGSIADISLQPCQKPLGMVGQDAPDAQQILFDSFPCHLQLIGIFEKKIAIN
jgi:hypothetical protein